MHVIFQTGMLFIKMESLSFKIEVCIIAPQEESFGDNPAYPCSALPLSMICCWLHGTQAHPGAYFLIVSVERRDAFLTTVFPKHAGNNSCRLLPLKLGLPMVPCSVVEAKGPTL